MHLKKILLRLLLACINVCNAYAPDSITYLPTKIIEPSPNLASTGIVKIYNRETKRIITLDSGKHVRVHCDHKKRSKVKIKRAVITHINSEQITFQPISKRYHTISYTLEENIHADNLRYIEITTIDSVIGGVIVNGLLITGIIVAAGVIFIICAIPALLTRTDPGDWIVFGVPSGQGKGLPFSNLRKHIHLHGDSKWELQYVPR